MSFVLEFKDNHFECLLMAQLNQHSTIAFERDVLIALKT